MKFGVIYPQTEFGTDRAAVKEYAQLAEELGYSHIGAFDHVLGVNPDRPGGWKGPYTYQSTFLEPFVLFSFWSGFTRRIGFASEIIILPQRQTGLVAKQAATLDVLSQGRLRLGVGLGWNAVEYTALGENFHNRGRRIEEQVQLLRQLLSQPLVDFSGRWHTVPDAGINPLPIQRPVPIWFGGHDDRVIERIARLGDGWFPTYRTPADAAPHFEKMASCLAGAGRSMDLFGIEVRIYYGDGNPDIWKQLIQGWKAIGATHCSFTTLGAGFARPEEHMQAIRMFAQETGLS